METNYNCTDCNLHILLSLEPQRLHLYIAFVCNTYVHSQVQWKTLNKIIITIILRFCGLFTMCVGKQEQKNKGNWFLAELKR